MIAAGMLCFTFLGRKLMEEFGWRSKEFAALFSRLVLSENRPI